ncbi:MAG: ArsI/CadI family heavy metal resistance metalloenzyme [Cyanobacteria bacterium P01_E01_bin.35]
MSRIQLALNVSNLDESVAFYSRLLEVEPAKRRPGYANFAVAQPPLKLVLIENAAQAGTLNHLGVEVETSEEVAGVEQRLQARGLKTKTENQVTCCYAEQDKVWVNDPDRAPWEIYTVLNDSQIPYGNVQAEKSTPCPPACVSNRS